MIQYFIDNVFEIENQLLEKIDMDDFFSLYKGDL